jgi:hypothetical protein
MLDPLFVRKLFTLNRGSWDSPLPLPQCFDDFIMLLTNLTHLSQFCHFFVDTCCKDCAGAILYSTEKAVEVTLEAMQCLGGNGYINGEKVFDSALTDVNRRL